MRNSLSKNLHLPDLLNSIILLFSTLKSIRHSSDQSVSASKSCYNISRSLSFLMIAISLLSSAKSLIKWLTTSCISKRRGPRTLPCGTPLVTSLHAALCSPIKTLCLRLVKKSLIQLNIPLLKPKLANFLKREKWQTLSKALAKSRKTTRTFKPVSKLLLIKSTVSSRFVTVDYLIQSRSVLEL